MGSPEKVIMVADDDPAILDFLSIMLEYAGYKVITTVNGLTVLDINGELPDLLLLDIWMSGVDGRDVCKELKRKKDTSKLPVIMISASKDIENSARESGADDFLAKPFEMDELLKKIKQLVN